jgi:hypothetical protein
MTLAASHDRTRHTSNYGTPLVLRPSGRRSVLPRTPVLHGPTGGDRCDLDDDGVPVGSMVGSVTAGAEERRGRQVMNHFVQERLARLVWLVCGAVGSVVWEVIRATR